MSDEVIIIDDFGDLPVVKSGNKKESYTILSDTDDENDNNNNNNDNIIKQKQHTTSAIDCTEDDDLIQIFGVGSTRKLTATSTILPLTKPKNISRPISVSNQNHVDIRNSSFSSQANNINHSLVYNLENDDIQLSSMQPLNTRKQIPSELIYLDDDDNDENNSINNNNHHKNANASSSIINTSTSHINSYPTSSPTLERTNDIMNLNQDSELRPQKRSINLISLESTHDMSHGPKRVKNKTARERANLDPIPVYPQISVSSSNQAIKHNVKTKNTKTLDSRIIQDYLYSFNNNNNNNVDNNSDVGDSSEIEIQKGKENTIRNITQLAPILKKVKNSKSNQSKQGKKHSTESSNESSAKSSRSSTNIFNTDIPISDISDFNSSMSDIYYNELKVVSNQEIKEKQQSMKVIKKKEASRIKDLKSELKVMRNNRKEVTNKYSKIASNNYIEQKVSNLHSSNVDSVEEESIENSNSSLIINNNTSIREKFMDIVTDDIQLYSDERLKYLLERSKQFDTEKLKKANKINYTKDELTERITCCFSTNLDQKFKLLNKDYGDFLKPAHFEVIEEILPIVRFKRYVDKILYGKKNTYVPVKPRYVFEDFILLIYEAKDIITLVGDGLMRKHLNTIKSQYPESHMAVWIIDYDAFLQKLKTKTNNIYKDRIYQKLGPDPTENIDKSDETSKNNKKSKNKSDNQKNIHPKHLKQKLLRYEIEYDFSFQPMKGLKDLLEWLKSLAYTLTCKYIDFLERLNGISSISKVKSGDNAKSCLIQMLSNVKFCTERRAKVLLKKSLMNVLQIYLKMLFEMKFCRMVVYVKITKLLSRNF